MLLHHQAVSLRLQPNVAIRMGEVDYLFKFIVVGDSSVGKSCLLMQFIEQRFKNYHELTLGIEFGQKILSIDGKSVKLQLWDTVGARQAGQETFASIARSYYRGAAGALIAFDITNRDSFEHIERWLCELKTNTTPGTPIVLIGNKVDLARK